MLQVDLAIPCLGHRKGLMQAIQDLRQHSTAHRADDPCEACAPASVPGSPVSVTLHHMEVGVYKLV